MNKYQLTIDDIIGDWAYSKGYVRNVLSGFNGKPVNVKISSLGGSVDHALDIRQQFADHGDVTAYIFGFTASAATILAMGAKKVCMSKYAMFLVHKCSNWVDAWGQYNADQIQELIEQLKENKLQNDKIDLVIASIYADKCKKQVNDILDILKEGKWLTAEEAKEIGLVDEILEDESDDKVDYASLNNKLNAFGLTPYKQPSKKEDKTSGVLDKILHKLDNLVGNKNDNTAQNKITMKEDYKGVNTILNVKGLDFDKDAKCTLTEAQVKAIEDAFKTKDDAVTAKDQKIQELNTQVENLQNKPGDETTHVEDGGKDDIDSASSAKKMYNNFKDLL